MLMVDKAPQTRRARLAAAPALTGLAGAGTLFAAEPAASAPAMPGPPTSAHARLPFGSSNRTRRPCTRLVRAGAFAQQARSGRNAKRFLGRIGSRRLAPGRSRAPLVATDAAGNRSRPKRAAFRVVRP